MSAIAFPISVAIAFLATLAWAAISGGWNARAFAATFVFGLAILILPLVVHV